MINKKGQITIIAKNMNIKAMNKIQDDAGIIKNTAGKRFIQKGNKGIVHGKNIPPKDDLRVKKVEGAFDDSGNKIDVISNNKWYKYKVSMFSREPGEKELKALKWGIRYDDGKINILTSVSNKGYKEIKLRISDRNFSKIQIYAFFKKPIDQVSMVSYNKHIKLVITDQVIGYTIMRLFDIADDFNTTMVNSKFPACIVKVYRVDIRYYEGDKVLNYGSFGVTRDGWQKIDEQKGKYFMINRAFEPVDNKNNRYKIVHSFVPYQYKGLIKIDAFEFKTFQNKLNLPAEPIYTNHKLDNKTPIPHQRKKIDEITNVNIHIGGHYTRGRTLKKVIERQYSSPTTLSSYDNTTSKIEESGIHWLGGSLGCFAFVEKEDIKPNYNSAYVAHKNKEYRINTSNREWQNIVNKIHALEKEKNVGIIVEVTKRENYKKVIENFNPKDILWE